MAVTEMLRLLVEADTKGAVREVETLGKTADRELSRSKTSLDKWGSGLKKVGSGMATFGAVALAGLGAAAMASEEAQLSVVKLENTLANMPKLAGENKQQFIDLADAIQDKTAADGDAIVAGEAMLGTFNLTADQIKDITPLVVDYARKFGLDIPQAATMVGKALDGSVGALKRNGVSIDEVAYKTDRYGAVQQALSDQVGGFAEAEGRTFAGSLQRLKNELGDVVEGVGVGAVDAFTDLAGAADFVTDKFDSLSPGTQSLIGKIATFGAVGLVAAGGVSMLVGQVMTMHDRFSAAADAASNITGKLGGLKTVLAGAGIAGAIIGIGAAVDSMREAANAKEIDNVTEAFVSMGTKIDDSFKDTIRTLESAGELDTVFENLRNSNEAAAERFIDTAEAAGVSADAIDDMRASLEQKRQADQQGAIDQEANTEAVREGSDAYDEQTDEVSAAEEALKEYQDTLRGTFDPLFAMSDALADSQQAHADLTTKTLEAAAAQEAYDNAVRRYGEDSSAAREAAAANIEAHNALADAQRNARSSAVDLQSAAAQLRFEIDENGLSVDEARSQFIGMVTQMGYTRAEAEAVAGDFGLLDDEATRLTRPRPPIGIATAGTVQARNNLTRVRDAAFSIPTRRNTHVTTSGTQYAVGQLDDVARAINAIAGHGNVHVSVGGGGGFILHEGGIVPGPRGQEIAGVLLGGEEVLDYDDPRHSANLASARRPALAGVGGGQVIVNHFHIAGSVIAERQLMELANKKTRKGRGLN